jgi:hypothetical protein
MSHILWLHGLEHQLSRQVRDSWEASVFEPGDKVIPDEFAAQSDPVAFETLVRIWDEMGRTSFTVSAVSISIEPSIRNRVFLATCSLVECEGVWPIQFLADFRKCDLIYGALISDTDGTWMLPLRPGSSSALDRTKPVRRLRPLLGRQARHALGRAQSIDLPPLIGEFVIACEGDGTDELKATLWTGPLDQDSMVELRIQRRPGRRPPA